MLAIRQEGTEHHNGCGGCIQRFQKEAERAKAAQAVGGPKPRKWQHVPYCQRPRGRKGSKSYRFTEDCGTEWHKGHRCYLFRMQLSNHFMTEAETNCLSLWFKLNVGSFKGADPFAIARLMGFEITPRILSGLSALDSANLEYIAQKRREKEAELKAKQRLNALRYR